MIKKKKTATTTKSMKQKKIVSSWYQPAVKCSTSCAIHQPQHLNLTIKSSIGELETVETEIGNGQI